MSKALTKVCKKCGEVKILEDFHKKSTGKCGVATKCKLCRNQDNDWRLRNRERHLDNCRRWYEENKVRKHAKQLEWNAANATKIKESRRARYLKNKEHNLATCKKWAAANVERVREASRTRYLRNRTARLALQRQRRQSIPSVRLAHNLRARLKAALRIKSKTGSAVRDLGMPIDAFLVYLNLGALDKYGIPYTGNEKLFHIDHIKPLISFDLLDPEQLRIAVRWDNLQVLLARENLRKGGRV